jgi:uncharacterized protein (TIGR02284 family)
MQNNAKTIEVLNDLIRINNDRISGYKKAIDEAGDLNVDLKAMFANFISDSETYKSQLQNKVAELGGDATGDSTTVAGTIYRAWMDVKATFTGADRSAILASCEFGEDAAQNAYKAALDESGSITSDAVLLITDQRAALKNAHDIIKKYRDVHQSVGK